MAMTSNFSNGYANRHASTTQDSTMGIPATTSRPHFQDWADHAMALAAAKIAARIAKK